MNFRYEAIDARVTRTSGVVAAASVEAARRTLAKRGTHATSIKETDEAAGNARGSAAGSGKRISIGGGKSRLTHMVGFSRQMAMLVSTGTPVTQALEAVEAQTTDDGFRAVVAGLRTKVESGTSLSEAMSDQPKMFDPVSQSLVQAGESSGQLPAMLDRLALLTRQQEALNKAVGGALAYPVMLFAVSSIVIVCTLITVVPRFAGMFESLGSEIPSSTAALLWVSGAMQAYWWAIAIGLAVVGATGWKLMHSPSGRRAVHGMSLRAPLFGTLVRDLALARVCRLLGVLITSRVPLLEALDLTRRATGLEPVKHLIARAEESVLDGNPLADVLAASPIVTPSIAAATRSAEASGKLGEVLTSLADHLDEDNQVVVKSLSSILEPVILTVLGGVVGVVALSLFLPLFDLTAAAGGPK
ncbi:MAG: type II secretion system F family protein [Planctomycetota bacterium]